MKFPAARTLPLALAFCLFSLTLAPASLASPLAEIDVTIVSNDGSSATVDIFMTMPDEGLAGYTFSVAYGGTLTFDSGTRFAPPGMFSAGPFNNGGAGPGVVTGIGALTSPPFLPVGVGAVQYKVATLSFDLNGAGGNIQTGAFFTGVDGFVFGGGDFTEIADFAGANLSSVSFGSALVLVPEPGTGALLALGLGGLAARARRARR